MAEPAAEEILHIRVRRLSVCIHPKGNGNEKLCRYDVTGIKDILGVWIGESEGKHYWMQIFDEIRARGVEDILFISMDGVAGHEEGARSFFKNVVVQRCIVHLIRNSIKYIPSKDYKAYTVQLKKVYGAASLKAAVAKFERFRQNWSSYPGLWMCGEGTECTWSSFSTMEAQCVK